MFIEACYMPDSGPDNLWSVPSVPTIALCYRYCYYPHFIDKETEAERVILLTNISVLKCSRIEIQSKAVCLQKTLLLSNNTAVKTLLCQWERTIH